MTDNLSESSLYSKSTVCQLLVSLLVIVVIGGCLFILLILPGVFIFSPDIEVLRDPSSYNFEKNILFLRYLLISQHLSLFIIPGIILIYLLRKPSQGNYPELRMPGKSDIIYVIILAFCLLPVTGITGELNAGMKFPDWLSGVESWMKEKEDMAEQLFDLILARQGFGSFVVSLIMIAILPAIGEELIFRGIIQKILAKMFRSGHMAVWITAFFFSALHFQFYGFLPRFILGLVFGYLFLWSGILWLPVLAHFTNNAASLITSCIQSPSIHFSSVEIPFWQQLAILPLPLLAITIILSYFKSKAEDTFVSQSFLEVS